jgi:hypothetical protein
MNSDKKMISSTFSNAGKFSKEVNEVPEQDNRASQPDECLEGWDELDADDKAQKEVILQEHFQKALARFNAGVSLAKIRRHYEKLGAKYSPVTFRKKWDELVKNHAEQV